MLRRNGALWSGREGHSPAPVEPAHGSWRDSPGNSRLGPRDYLGRGSCPPSPGEQHETRSLFFSNKTGRTKCNKPPEEKVLIGYSCCEKQN